MHVIERLVQFLAISILYFFEKVKSYKCYYLVWFIDALPCIFNILYESGLWYACMIRFCLTYNVVWSCLYLIVLCSFLSSFIYLGNKLLQCFSKCHLIPSMILMRLDWRFSGIVGILVDNFLLVNLFQLQIYRFCMNCYLVLTFFWTDTALLLVWFS